MFVFVYNSKIWGSTERECQLFYYQTKPQICFQLQNLFNSPLDSLRKTAAAPLSLFLKSSRNPVPSAPCQRAHFASSLVILVVLQRSFSTWSVSLFWGLSPDWVHQKWPSGYQASSSEQPLPWPVGCDPSLCLVHRQACGHKSALLTHVQQKSATLSTEVPSVGSEV